MKEAGGCYIVPHIGIWPLKNSIWSNAAVTSRDAKVTSTRSSSTTTVGESIIVHRVLCIRDGRKNASIKGGRNSLRRPSDTEDGHYGRKVTMFVGITVDVE